MTFVEINKEKFFNSCLLAFTYVDNNLMPFSTEHMKIYGILLCKHLMTFSASRIFFRLLRQFCSFFFFILLILFILLFKCWHNFSSIYHNIYCHSTNLLSFLYRPQQAKISWVKQAKKQEHRVHTNMKDRRNFLLITNEGKRKNISKSSSCMRQGKRVIFGAICLTF